MQAIPYFARTDGAASRLYQDVVLEILKCSNVLGKAHHIYFDNYYSSVPMFSDLARHFKTYCCGTIRLNRKYLPKDLMVRSHRSLNERGQSLFSISSELVLSVWKDRKLIHVLSSIHGTILSTCQRTMKDVSGHFVRKEVSCPQAIRDYSRFMGGVDLSDQLYQYYCFGRKSRKWTKKLFWFSLEVMKMNSSIMFNSVQEKSLPLYDFTLHVLKQLIADADRTERIPPTIPDANKPDRLTRRCFPSDLGRKAYCRVCYERNKVNPRLARRQTRYGCSYCNRFLCLPECFRIYHTEFEYDKLVVLEE